MATKKNASSPARIHDKFSDVTPKQKKLVDEFLILNNGTRAAINAGYAVRSASATASKELAKPKVRAYLNYRKEILANKHNVLVDRLIAQWEEIAFADIRDFVDKNGNVKQFSSKFKGRAVQSIRHTRHGIDITLQSQEKARESLGRVLGIFKDNLDVTSKGEVLNQQIQVTYEEVPCAKEED